MSYISGGTTNGVLRLTAPATTPAVAPAAEGRIYFDGTTFQVSENGGAFVTLTNPASGGGWTDDGTVVRLTTATDGLGVGIAGIAASSKLEVLGDATRKNVLVTGGAPGGATDGGSITLTGGAGGTTGVGGGVNLYSGNGGSASQSGNIEIVVGNAAAAGQNSGSILLYCGAAGTGGVGGGLELDGGDVAPGGGGTGGYVSIIAGQGGDTGTAGAANMRGGYGGNTSGNGGESGVIGGFVLGASGNGGEAYLYGGETAVGLPGQASVYGGDATGGTANGGICLVRSGLPFDGAGGASGAVNIETRDTTGFTNARPTGILTIRTGNPADQADSGNLVIATGDVATGAGTPQSGSITIKTGAAPTESSSGNISILTPIATQEGGDATGQILVQCAGGGAAGGKITLDANELVFTGKIISSMQADGGVNTSAATNLNLGVAGTDYWRVNLAGHFFPISDNTLNIGDLSSRVQNLYVKTILQNGGDLRVVANGTAPRLVLECDGTNPIILKTNGIEYWRVSGGTGDILPETNAGASLGSDPKRVASLFIETSIDMKSANIVTDTTTGMQIATGNTQKLGFWGAAPVVQSAVAALTNNVTAGGTTNVIADFTDLVVYANDAATIRNDIYQLALKLKDAVDALRLYGLLG